MPASGREDLLDLCSRLRGEKLLVTSEVELLQQLNRDVDLRLAELLQYSWLSRQQQFTLSKLLSAHPDATPQNCCRQTRTLSERTEFVDGYKRLGGGVNECAVVELLLLLYENSRLMAECLHRWGYSDPQQIFDLSHVVFSAVYGCAVFPSDERRVLETLYYLMRLQLLPNAAQARRLLRRGTCAFSRLYKWLITDGGGIYSTKLFLLSALHQPIIDLISSEELFLDIDPSKAVIRFPPSERLRRFGEEGSPAYRENLNEHRREIVSRLVSLAQRFIHSLRLSFAQCFPPPLAWLLRQLYESLTSSGKTTPSEGHLIVTDLVFTCFICPAIANPEPLGIVIETPITHIARFNLIQIGQIIQTLAVSPWERVDTKLMDLYSQLDTDSVSSLVPALLAAQLPPANRATSPQAQRDDGNMAAALCSLEEVYEKGNDASKYSYGGSSGQPSVRCALITVGELNRLITALRRAAAQEPGQQGDGRDESLQKLQAILSRLPESFVDDQPLQTNGNSSISPSSTNGTGRKKTPLKLPKPRMPTMMQNSPSVERFQNLLTGGGTNDPTSPDGGSPLNRSEPDIVVAGMPVQEVLMIPLGGQRDPIGLISEDTFFSSSVVSVPNASTSSKQRAKEGENSGPPVSNATGTEKRTRFSLQNQQDLESVGTSDQLDDDDHESMSSSLEGGTNPDMMQGLLMNDNFSDVDVAPSMSPNVSARGSPNVSGRDTPLSSHTENQPEPELDPPVSPVAACASGDTSRHHDRDRDNATASGHQPRHHHGAAKRALGMPDLPVTAQKENGADIEEKFGKFEIPAAPHHRERHRDETHSLVSDSWSTDVLASDSEFGSEYLAAAPPGGICPAGALPDIVPGQMPEFPRLDLIAEEGAAAAAAASGGGGGENMRGIGIPPARLEALSGTEGETSGAGCDRSDTWSVDAVASDSEVDATSVSQRNEELRDLEMEEARDRLEANVASSGPPSRGSRPRDIGEAAGAGDPSGRGASIPPEITFSMERDFHQLDRSVVRRQSSGGSFLSRRSDPEYAPRPDQAKSTATAASSSGSADKDTGKVDANKKSIGDSSMTGPGRGQLSSASSDASSVDTSSARAVSGSPTAEERQLAAMRGTGAIPKKIRQISAHLAGTLDRTRPFIDPQQGPLFGGGDADSRRGFFKGFNKGLSNLKSKVTRSQTASDVAGPEHVESPNDGAGTVEMSSGGTITYSASMDSFQKSVDSSADGAGDQGETSDEILAKYRRQKPAVDQPISVGAVSTDPLVGCETGGTGETSFSNGSTTAAVGSSFEAPAHQDCSEKCAKSASETYNQGPNGDGPDRRPYFDPQNTTQCQAFLDAKRKLRQVLSTVDVAILPTGFDNASVPPRSLLKDTGSQSQQNNHDLIQFLNLLLADALTDNRMEQQKFLTAQLRETLRCLALFDNKTIRKLLRVLHEEHRRRTVYVTYLQQSRLTLLQMRAYLEKLMGRVMRENILSRECLLELCSRIFLEQRWEQQLRRFVGEFHRSEAHDEKTDLVEQFLAQLYSAMQKDPIWQWASEEQVQFARLSIERSVMAQIYLAAMYPNGEGDTMRDQVFYETIRRLAVVVTPDHRDLRIPVEYHAECPWPSAQAEIAIINAYKTPRDKVGCVVRCCHTIVSLLRLARPDGRPAADDLVPVLVYVIIKSNPPGLLSTVQYVNGFYGTRLQGEEAYWWTQFCSALEFIKMMADYHQGN